MIFHKAVLLKEVVEFLKPRPGAQIIDATIGGGGHTFELLRAGARVLGIDRDPEAIEHIKNKLKTQNSKLKTNLVLVQGNFSHIGEIAKSNGFTSVDGILFDLGVSSHQLEQPQRGFSFQKEGPLDMRMDPTLTITAKDLVNNFDRRRLNEIFKTFGEKKHSWAIASAICRARQIKPIETTKDLAQIIEHEYFRGAKDKFKNRNLAGRSFGQVQIHPATKAFQALRIVVNSELLNLEEALPQTVNLLKSGGRLVVISFHSLEDVIVKRFFKQEAQLRTITAKPVGPQAQEIRLNPRSRSAKLRIAERV